MTGKVAHMKEIRNAKKSFSRFQLPWNWIYWRIVV